MQKQPRSLQRPFGVVNAAGCPPQHLHLACLLNVSTILPMYTIKKTGMPDLLSATMVNMAREEEDKDDMIGHHFTYNPKSTRTVLITFTLQSTSQEGLIGLETDQTQMLHLLRERFHLLTLSLWDLYMLWQSAIYFQYSFVSLLQKSRKQLGIQAGIIFCHSLQYPQLRTLLEL